MGRPRKLTPSYLEHKQSGRGRVVWTDSSGKQQQQLLPGAYESKESREAYGRFLLEQEVAPKVAAISGREDLLLNELLDAYRLHAERHYRGADGRPTSELAEVNLVLRSCRELYGLEPAAAFSPMRLKAVRQGWVLAKLSRGEVNRRTNIVRRVFKWAVAEELVPVAVFTALATVTGLQKGRTTARETEPVVPVDDATVDATLPHLNRFVRGLVEFQRLTGCRPGEACLVRRADIDTGGKVWLYRPVHHKNKHRGKSRVIAIGPKAQEVLKPFFTPDLSDYLFQPGAAVEEFRAERTKNRQTPRFASHMERNKRKRKKNPKRAPADHYTTQSYNHTIDRACDRAFPPSGELAQRENETAAQWQARLTPGQVEQLKEWRKAHRWHPNQLRHSFATKVRKAKGLEAAQVMLGHEKADVTQIYAERNESLAVSVAAEVG